jgi:hypothetical protein
MLQIYIVSDKSIPICKKVYGVYPAIIPAIRYPVPDLFVRKVEGL